MTGKGRGFVRSRKGILALVLTVALLAGCGRAAPAPVQQTPAPVSGSEAAPVRLQGLLTGSDGRYCCTPDQQLCDAQTMTARPFPFPEGSQETVRGEPVTDGQFWYYAVKISEPEQEKFHIWRMGCDGKESEIILEADADQWPISQSLDAHLDPAARLVVFSREQAIYFFLNNSKDFSLHIFRCETGESCAQQVGQTKPMKDAVFCGERNGLPVFSTWDGEELIYLQLDLDTGETSELFRRDAGEARCEAFFESVYYWQNSETGELYAMDLVTGEQRLLWGQEDTNQPRAWLYGVLDGQVLLTRSGVREELLSLDIASGALTAIHLERPMDSEYVKPPYPIAMVQGSYLLEYGNVPGETRIFMNRDGELEQYGSQRTVYAMISPEDYRNGQSNFKMFDPLAE